MMFDDVLDVLDDENVIAVIDDYLFARGML